MNEILEKGKKPATAATSEADLDDAGFPGEDSVPESACPPAGMRPELLKGIHLRVRAELGRRSLLLKDALRLDEGSVIDLETRGDDPVNLYVNDVLMARGIVTVVDDCFCIRITEVLQAMCEDDQ